MNTEHNINFNITLINFKLTVCTHANSEILNPDIIAVFSFTRLTLEYLLHIRSGRRRITHATQSYKNIVIL